MLIFALTAAAQLIDTLASTIPAPRLSDASALAAVYVRRGAGMVHIVRLVRAEISATTSAAALFRTPSLASVLLMRFVKLACADYVVDVLGTAMTTLCAMELGAIDPDLALREDGAPVRDRLAGLLRSLLDTLCNSAPLVSALSLFLRFPFASDARARLCVRSCRAMLGICSQLCTRRWRPSSRAARTPQCAAFCWIGCCCRP